MIGQLRDIHGVVSDQLFGAVNFHTDEVIDHTAALLRVENTLKPGT